MIAYRQQVRPTRAAPPITPALTSQINRANGAKAQDGWWTDDRIAELRMLWRTGSTCREIAERIGTTKNAVIGKAYRLELPARDPRDFR